MSRKSKSNSEIPASANQPRGDFLQEHVSVLRDEALDLLDVTPGKIYVDATAGAGGHLLEISRRLSGSGTVIGIDRDRACVDALTARSIDQAVLVHSNYSHIKEIVRELGFDTVTGGILADLGVSSMQLDDPARGFSFQQDGPLDMRMDPSQPVTAEHLINTLSERDLSDIFFRYGEEKRSRQIAHAIVRDRPFHSTLELADVVARTLRKFQSDYKHGKKHPATRTFQALRIAVNEELSSLEIFLNDCLEVMAKGSRLVVITFHSLEDRIVKQFLRQKSLTCVCPPRQPVCTCNTKAEIRVLTRKPIVASEDETIANVRARSAKLRAGEKLD